MLFVFYQLSLIKDFRKLFWWKKEYLLRFEEFVFEKYEKNEKSSKKLLTKRI